jgi:hypothetical protein
MFGSRCTSVTRGELARKCASWSRRVVSVGLATWLGSCSFLLTADQKQCSTDGDCIARGLNGSICVANLCQLLTNHETSGSRASGEVSSGQSQEPASEPPAMNPSAGEGGRAAAPARAGSTGGAANAAGASGMSISVSLAAGASGMAANRAGAGGAAACSGSGCPECTVDADCALRGLKGGVCADSMCWAPKAECSADKDCEVMGPEFVGGRCVDTICRANPRWRCEVPPPAAPSATKELKVLVRDSLSLSAVPDVKIVACQKLDLMCSAPVTSGKTDKDGYLSFTVPGTFAGYLQQTERTDYAPAMYFLPAVLPADGMLEPFPLLGSGVIIDALAAALGAMRDPTRGNMMLIAEDCMGMALAGVQFSSPQADKNTVQFYVRDLLPSPTAKETAEVGNGGYLNFPAGTAILNVKETKDSLDLATVSVVVRAGFISVAYIRPKSRDATR